MAAIGARFGITAALGAGVGEGAAAAAAAAGLAVAPPRRVQPFPLPPGLLTATAVGSFLDLPQQFGPPVGWWWDITMLSLTGFTAGAVIASKNAPAVTAGGNPAAVELVWTFAAAGQQAFPQKGNPLLAPGDRLVFTVSSVMTGAAQIGGAVVMVPAERLDDYLS
jgi:hypothetical protein